ncbi:predicted protein [Naegleria gruberi]|uniref:Predicted protein n=1 Tax=Naegleria gruberi TaxID=5762 RepID=D2VAF4_NAEGR|nr:uncharacterized protein NAEGRDRAFT_65840 [Naegleria gruberi]EFC46418.1 predicted protein [Naegleria gruberi]|eukprot:XP_002679162.1 predicted protein [Naegleria gruberi strain NEG-M]
MKISCVFSCLLVFITLIGMMSVGTEGVLVKMVRGSKACLHEHLSENTPFKLTVRPYFNRPDSAQLRVTDPYGHELKSEMLDKAKESVFHLKAHSGVTGEYEICFDFSPSIAVESFIDVRVDVDVHYHLEKEPQTVDQLDRLSTLLKDIKNQIDIIRDEQTYFRTRESRFRDTTDSTYERTFWIGFLKFVFIVFGTTFQLISLRSFFKTKKLI